MTDQAINPSSGHLDIADAERRIKAIFIGSVGNLVEWYDFYAYTAFALYFAPADVANAGPNIWFASELDCTSATVCSPRRTLTGIRASWNGMVTESEEPRVAGE